MYLSIFLWMRVVVDCYFDLIKNNDCLWPKKWSPNTISQQIVNLAAPLVSIFKAAWAQGAAETMRKFNRNPNKILDQSVSIVQRRFSEQINSITVSPKLLTKWAPQWTLVNYVRVPVILGIAIYLPSQWKQVLYPRFYTSITWARHCKAGLTGIGISQWA